MTEVSQLFADRQPGPEPEVIGPTFVDTARAIAAICATRVLLLITVLTGSAIWLWTTLDPAHDRLYVAVAFSVVFVIPQVLLFWRRG